MKKILFIINGLVKNGDKVGVSGGDVRLAEIAKNVQGYQLEVLTTSNGNEFLKNFDVKFKENHLINYSIDSGIWSNLKISILSFFSLPKSLSNYKSEIVYSACEHLYDVLPALRLKLLNKCKWYAVYHWVEDYPWKEKRGNTPFLKRYVYWLNRWFSGFLIKIFADRILAVSDQTKDKLINIKHINPNKIKAVYCGVDFDEISKIGNKYSKEKGLKYDAVYMKRLNNGKGIWDLLNIWKIVCEENNKLKLGVIGDGSPEIVKEIKDWINLNNLKHNIDLLGVIYDMEDKFKVLNSSKLFILPTHEENWAIVIGEAMAIKLPVLCYNLKEITPIWGENVEWIDFANREQFANQIHQYIEDKDKRDSLSKKAFEFIKKYDWKAIAKEEFNSLNT